MKGVMRNNLILLLGIVLILAFIFASHDITPTSYSINETIQYTYNISVDNTDAGQTANITQVNITIPDTFTFTAATNGSDSVVELFENTSIVLSWTNSTVYLINGSEQKYFWFNASASTPGNYNITVTTTNSTGSYSSNISVEVNDTTAPTVSFNNPVTQGNYSDTFILNVTVTDESSLGTIFFNITNSSGIQNATYTASNPSGNLWNATLNTSNFPDGVYNITVYANDSVGNSNNSVLVYNVTFDNTNPSVSFSCSPTSVLQEDTVTCTCSGTDATSGVQTTSYTASPSTLVYGTFTETCTVTDYSGNSASATASYTVTSRGGGGGDAEQPPQRTHSWTKITPGVVTIMKDFDEVLGIKQIQVMVNNEAQDVKITVTKYEGKPAEVTKEKSGKVYHYLHINAKNLENKLSKGILEIKVDKSWVSNNGWDKEDVAMFKFDEVSEEWDELETVYSEADDDSYYYVVELDAFSYFAISEKTLVAGEVQGEDGEEATEEGKGLGGVWITLISVAGGLLLLGALYWFFRDYFDKLIRDLKLE